MSAPRKPDPRAEEKTCAVCGRRIEWRKKWERDWENVQYCSKGCRSRGLGSVDEALERAILALLAERGRGKTLCPSEAARRVAEEHPDLARAEASRASGSDQDAAEPWRALMEPTRMAVRRLVAAGEVEILQKGRVVDPSTARGAVRVRRSQRPVVGN